MLTLLLAAPTQIYRASSVHHTKSVSTSSISLGKRKAVEDAGQSRKTLKKSSTEPRKAFSAVDSSFQPHRDHDSRPYIIVSLWLNRSLYLTFVLGEFAGITKTIQRETHLIWGAMGNCKTYKPSETHLQRNLGGHPWCFERSEQRHSIEDCQNLSPHQ